MLRLAYLHFMQELQKEIKEKVGLPYQVKIDIRLGVGDNIPKEKVEEFMNNTLQPILKEIPDKVIMS